MTSVVVHVRSPLDNPVRLLASLATRPPQEAWELVVCDATGRAAEWLYYFPGRFRATVLKPDPNARLCDRVRGNTVLELPGCAVPLADAVPKVLADRGWATVWDCGPTALERVNAWGTEPLASALGDATPCRTYGISPEEREAWGVQVFDGVVRISDASFVLFPPDDFPPLKLGPNAPWGPA